MNSRDRVMAAASHREPDRTPFSWGFGPTGEMSQVLRDYALAQGMDWGALRAAVDDIRSVDSFWVGGELAPGEDIWGVRRRAMAYGGGAYQEISHYPLAGTDSLHQLDSYPWPDPKAFDYSSIRRQMLEANPEQFRAMRISGGNPFEIYCWMTGLEEAMMNLALAPEVVHGAMERITSFFEERLASLLDAAGDLVDLVFLADDLGGQSGLLLSRRMYREMIQPYHVRLSSLVHSAAPHAKTLFHSDGAVFDIIPDIIDAGMDILEAVQTDAAGMGPKGLKEAYSGRIAFHGGISVQKTLPHASRAGVQEECRDLVATLGCGGGYIAAPTHAIQVGTPPENVLAMLGAVLGEDVYAECVEGARRARCH